MGSGLSTQVYQNDGLRWISPSFFNSVYNTNICLERRICVHDVGVVGAAGAARAARRHAHGALNTRSPERHRRPAAPAHRKPRVCIYHERGMSCPRTTPPNPYVLRVGKPNKSAKYDPGKVGQYPRKYGLDPNKPKDNIQSTKTKKLSDLEHIPWKCKAHVSGLSSPETAAMETIIKNIMHFCCHTTKQMLYECALKDGNFVNFARKGLLTVLKQERAWCMWTSVSHPGKKVRCNWTDEETTAHAMIRSVTHLHPIIIRYLISEFLQDRTVDELQKTLRLCLYWEINYYRDKMNNWDCRIYKYICQNSDVCIQIVNAFRRLGKDIVILEWMSDWTALLYFCQYERGPFYYFLHPLDTPNSKVLRSYKGEKQTTVCCTDSIVSLSSLTERDYLDLIKEAWDSEISYTQVDVTDTQILKIEKFRKCVEAHFLHTQHEFWKVQDRIRPNRTTRMFDDPSFPLLTKLSEFAAGAYWSDLKQQ